MEIKVFGPGCAKCLQTERLVREVVADRNWISVQKVSDLKSMLTAGVFSTPAVSVNGVVKAAGRVPRREEIVAWINDCSGKEQ